MIDELRTRQHDHELAQDDLRRDMAALRQDSQAENAALERKLAQVGDVHATLFASLKALEAGQAEIDAIRQRQSQLQGQHGSSSRRCAPCGKAWPMSMR